MKVVSLFIFFILSNNYVPFYIPLNNSHYTDEQLRKLAVKKGIIPAEPDKKYFKEQMEQRNTIIVWILMHG